MSCEVAVQELEQKGQDLPDADSLTPEEWLIVRFYRGLGEPDRKIVRRMLVALTARTVPD
ncbi:hypothetical protein IB229_12975 [Pseudomonas sp. PDM14]|uniref:hypothetical protein n=1 Tax=Pseudomonas sp. PDM14 TaxID=2769288 RepID=UPI001786A4E5|nr:hypothetical protein [Pseudomonas sp. PDM14]MBD9483892.1 hypothetical protein [Pseudomonas sp. PDM14]